MIRLMLALPILLCCASAFSQPTIPDPSFESESATEKVTDQAVNVRVCVGAWAKIRHVVDGDTFDADLRYPWGVSLLNERIRCLGYDACEVSRRRRSVDVTDEEIVVGKKATAALRRLLSEADTVYLIPSPDESARGPWGRIQAVVWIDPPDDRPFRLSEWMTQNRFTRDTWNSNASPKDDRRNSRSRNHDSDQSHNREFSRPTPGRLAARLYAMGGSPRFEVRRSNRSTEAPTKRENGDTGRCAI